MKTITGTLEGKGLSFGIVASRFNDLFVGQLLDGAVDCLQRHGVDEKNITVVRVTGAFEIPFALKKLAAAKKCNALIALGVVIQGATGHADLITSSIARAATQISVEDGVPVIDGVLGVQSLEQAMERSGAKQGNRGWSAAEAALEMANVARQLS
jgi:6,7-dimethyl-8-ribityllumazine synthase